MNDESFTIAELATAAHLAPRTIRAWVKQGLLPPVPFRGPQTVYGADQLLRIRAIKKLQSEAIPMKQIRIKIANLSLEQLDAIVNPVDPSTPRPPPEPSYPAERWEKLVLLPGLVLLVRDEPVLRQVAQQIYTHFGMRRSG